MTLTSSPKSGAELGARAQEALRIIIQQHVRSGKPVSSRTVAQLHPEELSAPTIRNLMAELTEAGFLSQPHVSAGRLPTDRAYRHLVDEVLASGSRVSQADARKVKSLLRSAREVDELLARAGRLLAELSHQVGVVLAPDLEKAVLEYVDFVRLAPRRLVAIFVSRAGLVSHRVIEPEEEFSQEELDRLSKQLREHFAGLTLPEVRSRLIEALREDHRWASKLGQVATESVVSLLEGALSDESGDLIVEGASSLLSAPEFADVDRLREVMHALEERSQLLELMDRCMRAPGVQVFIGAESRQPELAPMSVVASSYRAGPAMKGLVGIIGPRRMEYARAVALVDHFARAISGAIGESGHGPGEV